MWGHKVDESTHFTKIFGIPDLVLTEKQAKCLNCLENDGSTYVQWLR